MPHRHPGQAHHPPHQGGRCRPRLPGRGAVEPVPAGGRPRPAVPRRRHPGGGRRLSRLRLPGDAARTAARHRRGARAGRRRCSPARPRGGWTRSSPTPRRPAEADLQLHERPARLAAAGHAVPADRHRPPLQRDAGRLRRRPRLPVPVQLLHDHQRPGAQVALARRRRCRAAGARQPGAGRLPLFHHRRQFRPQPELGGDLRPADRRCARRRG